MLPSSSGEVGNVMLSIFGGWTAFGSPEGSFLATDLVLAIVKTLLMFDNESQRLHVLFFIFVIQMYSFTILMSAN